MNLSKKALALTCDWSKFEIMKYKIVIVEDQSDTEMTVGGTVYFATEQLARDYVTNHNATQLSCAYLVHVSPKYTTTDNS